MIIFMMMMDDDVVVVVVGCCSRFYAMMHCNNRLRTEKMSYILSCFIRPSLVGCF